MTVYIVTAYRWGNNSDHSYPLGVFENKDQAIKCADSHAEYRGGKYGCVVDECILGHFNNDDDDYTKEVYNAKSSYNRG